MSRKLFEKLARNYYILYFNGVLVVTNKFLREFKTPPPPEPVQETPQKVVLAERPFTPNESVAFVPMEANLPFLNTQLPAPIPIKKQPLLNFIMDTEMPERVRTQKGMYRINQYSKEAEKALIQALAQGFQYDILVACTKLYYKSGGMPKAIANYLIDGIYVGEYEMMKASLENNTVEKHIAKNLNKDDEDGHTRYER